MLRSTVVSNPNCSIFMHGFEERTFLTVAKFALANSRAERVLPQADKYLTNTCFKYSLRAECVIPMRTMFAWRFFVV